jgi:hypothetical protein
MLGDAEGEKQGLTGSEAGPASAGKPRSRPTGSQRTAEQEAAGSDVTASSGALRLRIASGYADPDQGALLALLRESGYESVLVEEIPFPITLSRVGYYAEADRSAAEDLARDVAPFLRVEQGEVAVRDYGNLLPDAEPGRLDLWIRSGGTD